MASRKPPTSQVWHASRGIVFASANTVVPRLPPSVRCYSASSAAASVSEGHGPAASLPSILPSSHALPRVAPIQEPPVVKSETVTTVKSEVIATLLETKTTTTSTTISVSASATSTISQEEEVTKDGQPTAAAAAENAAAKAEAEPEPVPEPEPAPVKTIPLVPPYTPLEYKIPDALWQIARNAEPGTPQSFWNYSMYRGPSETGALDVKVKVHYCTSSRTTERVVKEHFLHEKVVGFDLEWMANATRYCPPRRNVSLIQLASPSRIGLFHVAAFPRNDVLVSPALKQLLEDESITKVGVWIRGDSNRMANYLKVNVRGQLELSHLYKLVKYSKTGEFGLINKKLVSLASQVEDVLGLPLSKNSDVRMSDWSKPLSMAQILYSSSDAYASVQLFHTLDHHRKQLAHVPPLPRHAELNLPIPIAPPPSHPLRKARASRSSRAAVEIIALPKEDDDDVDDEAVVAKEEAEENDDGPPPPQNVEEAVVPEEGEVTAASEGADEEDGSTAADAAANEAGTLPEQQEGTADSANSTWSESAGRPPDQAASY